MKKYIIIINILCYSIVGFAQAEEYLNLLVADNTWDKEIIKFPISFAQEIKFTGYEDLRFPPGWAKKDSPEFWSYMWAWSLNDIRELTEKELETNVQLYFDGLMGINNSELTKTIALFIKKEAFNGNQYVGKVKTFDTRFTNKPMTLNVLVENFYCESENKTVIVFRFSPKDFTDDVWSKLKTVKLKDGFCEI